MNTFKKILIANRGEIAVRIIRTCRDMGIRTVAVYSEADTESLHVKLADEAYAVGPPDSLESYLDIEKTLAVAKDAGVDAIHPGYGFLSENPEFAEMSEKRGIAFIGPPSHCMSKAKPKNRARQLMKMINIPVTPGHDDAISDTEGKGIDEAREIAAMLGYPVVIKPIGGGGGIGIMIAKDPNELAKAVRSAESRGRNAFGVSGCYIEKYLAEAKHVEFQILADRHGNIVHLGDRDCSVQRRFQKIIEEAPCPMMTPFLRTKMGIAAIDVAIILQYVGALTVEFFYYPNTKKFYFNEINSRLQVEHCVTELVTGVDIVKEQIRIAAGEPLSLNQDDIRVDGHAIECRINAEDVTRNFIPSPGIITKLRLPHGPNIRIDEGIYENYDVPFYYDSLLMKLITSGKSRDEAISRMRRALGELHIKGIKTTAPLHQIIIDDEDFKEGKYTTSLLTKPELMNKLKNLKYENEAA
jgi:acetyl-CoA carboxylase biotin carboxylase subunit